MPDEKIATPFHEVASPDNAVDGAAEESTESFSELLAEFEHSHTHKTEGDGKQLEGTVVSLDAEAVYLDIGYKTEGMLPRTVFANNADGVEVGQKFSVSVKGRNVERYYELSLLKVAQATDWGSLEDAFKNKTAVVGTVTAVVKGGLSVDVGVRAFMPASRSGTREAGEMEKLVGTQITCRITKLDERGRGGDGDGSEPGDVRSVRRHWGRRWAAAYQRHGVESREGRGRCAECGR